MSSSDAPSAAVRTMIAALLHLELLEDVLQARALVVVEPARDAEALALRDEDDEAAGQRDLRRQAGALRLHRVLHRLDEDRLALADQVLDLAAVAALELGADDLVDVEEAVLLEADLDERGLHPRQDVVDRAEVDVAGDRAAVGPLEVDLGDLVVLEHGDALLADVDGDEQLALRGRQRCAARRLAAAAAASWRRRSCRCESVFRSGGLRSGGLRSGCFFGARFALSVLRLECGRVSGRSGFLRPRPPRLPRRRLGLVGSVVSAALAAAGVVTTGSGSSLACGCSRRGGWGVGFVLPSTEPGQAKTPSLERATATPRGSGRRARCWSKMKNVGMCLPAQGSSACRRRRCRRPAAPSDPGPTIRPIHDRGGAAVTGARSAKPRSSC